MRQRLTGIYTDNNRMQLHYSVACLPKPSKPSTDIARTEPRQLQPLGERRKNVDPRQLKHGRQSQVDTGGQSACISSSTMFLFSVWRQETSAMSLTVYVHTHNLLSYDVL